MKTKKFFALLLALAMLLALAACGNASADTNETNTNTGAKRKLVVANWQSYATDSDYGAAHFAELYDCEVEHYFLSSIPELLSVLENGGVGQIDVVCINPLYLQQYLNAGVLDTIDTSALENYNNLREDFRTIDEVKDENGNIIGVPWVWGTTSLFYNADVITDEITSWSALWNPQYAGKVAFENEYDAAIRTAAMYTGEDPRNPDTDTVRTALTDLKSNVKTYWTSHDDFVKAYTSGEVVIGNVWGSIATELKNEGFNIQYIHPEEGTGGWCDYWCIVRDSANKDLAMKWIDYCTGEYFQNSMATAGAQAYSPVNTVVTEALSDEARASLWLYPEAPANVNLALPLTDEQLTAWTSLWDEVKAAK